VNLRPQYGNRVNIAGDYPNLVPILAALVQHGQAGLERAINRTVQ
jgi:hypothetical protein